MATMFPRILELAILPSYQSFFLFGARTTGKSTLVSEYFKSLTTPTLTYNLLKSDDYLRLHSRPSILRHEIESLLKKQSSSILQVHIDEVQKIPPLLDEVHALLETYPKKVRFILSGSSARKLKKGGANLLAGRAWQRHLYPLTLVELGDDFNLDAVLRFGSLPPLLGISEEEKKEFLKTYVSTYLREEIQAEALTRRLDSFHRFLEAAARCNTELVNMTAVAQEAMVPRKTVASYYQILEDTMTGFFLPSWGHRLSRKELVTHGKFYFFDTGVVSSLNRQLDAPVDRQNPSYGKLFEHFCILEFLRLHDYKRTEHQTGFYRTLAGGEVDLVQERQGKIRAIEIKAQEQVRSADIRGLLGFGKDFPSAKLIVVCLAPQAYQIEGVTCFPYKDFLNAEWTS